MFSLMDAFVMGYFMTKWFDRLEEKWREKFRESEEGLWGE